MRYGKRTLTGVALLFAGAIWGAGVREADQAAYGKKRSITLEVEPGGIVCKGTVLDLTATLNAGEDEYIIDRKVKFFVNDEKFAEETSKDRIATATYDTGNPPAEGGAIPGRLRFKATARTHGASGEVEVIVLDVTIVDAPKRYYEREESDLPVVVKIDGPDTLKIKSINIGASLGDTMTVSTANEIQGLQAQDAPLGMNKEMLLRYPSGALKRNLDSGTHTVEEKSSPGDGFSYASIKESHIDLEWSIPRISFEKGGEVDCTHASRTTEYVDRKIPVARLSGGSMLLDNGNYSKRGVMTTVSTFGTPPVTGLYDPGTLETGWGQYQSDNRLLAWINIVPSPVYPFLGRRISIVQHRKQFRFAVAARRVGGMHELLDSAHFSNAVRMEQGMVIYGENATFRGLIRMNTFGSNVASLLAEMILSKGPTALKLHKAVAEFVSAAKTAQTLFPDMGDYADAALKGVVGAGNSGQSDTIDTGRTDVIHLNTSGSAAWIHSRFDVQRGRSYTLVLNMCCSVQLGRHTASWPADAVVDTQLIGWQDQVRIDLLGAR